MKLCKAYKFLIYYSLCFVSKIKFSVKETLLGSDLKFLMK